MADRLDEALADLATAIDFPPTPDLWRSVAVGMARPAGRPWLTPVPRALVLALIGLLVLAAAAAAAVLVLPGLRLSLVPGLPSVSTPPGPLATRMALGAAAPVADVAELAPATLGPPQEAYVIGDGDVVSLVYVASAELPELDGTGIGLLIQRIPGSLVRESVDKLVVEVGAVVTAVTVDGAPGYWITGPPHLLRFLDPNGVERAEATRLVGDTLVWERDGTLYRIESGLGLEETIGIAESIP
jgi:hypothetical protein